MSQYKVKNINVYVNNGRKFHCWMKLIEHGSIQEGAIRDLRESYFQEYDKATAIPKAGDILRVTQDELDLNCRSKN